MIINCTGPAAGEPFREIRNYEELKVELGVILVGTSRNLRRLAPCVHAACFDMSLVCVLIEDEGRGDSSLRYGWLPEDITAELGVAPETVLHDAIDAMQRRFPGKIRPIGQILQLEEDPAGLLVLTNAISAFGAAAMFYPHILREAAMRIGKSFFILPSSVHEVLLLPDGGEHDPRELHDMVAQINRTEVAAQDVLTDSVYYYDAGKPDAEALQIVYSAV